LFLALCIATGLAVLYLIYLLRMQSVARKFNLALETRVNERTRIARELHDTLLQSFQGLLLRFQTVHDLLRTRPAEAENLLNSVIDQAAQAITDGRNAVQGLRASTAEADDLPVAIRTLGELAAVETGNGSTALHVGVEGAPRTLNPILRDEVYRIAGEALRNAFRHAGAKQIEVMVSYKERQLQVRIRDDGRGIEGASLHQERATGHYGVRGMQERARLMGGVLAIWSAPGSGTEVELTIPAARAYLTRA
jgi:signal transduction histidine kinase